MLGKFRSTHRNPFVLKHSVGAFVSLLLCLSGPPTVFFTVPSVVINTVDGVVDRRALPHISHKVLETAPLFAQGDVSFSVPPSCQSVITSSTRAHVLPAPVRPALNSGSPRLGLPVGDLRLTYQLPGFAPAGDCLMLSKGQPLYWFYYSTNASAKPVDVAVSIFMGRLNDSEVPEYSSRQIFDVWVKWRDTVLDHHAHIGSMGGCSSGGQTASTAGSCAIFSTLTGGNQQT